jgi:hypothetical protein
MAIWHQAPKGSFLLTICILIVSLMTLSLLLVSCATAVTEEEEEAAPAKVEDKPLSVSGPRWVEIGDQATFEVTSNGVPVAGATVSSANEYAVTGSDGKAILIFPEEGDYEITATKEGYEGSQQFLFQDDFTSTDQWAAWLNPSLPLDPKSAGDLNTEGWSIEQEAGNSYLSIRSKLWVVPRLDALDKSSLVWTNYSFKSRFKIIEGALHTVFRLNDQGRYYVGLDSHGISLMKDSPGMSYSKEPLSDPAMHQPIKRKDILIGTSWHQLETVALDNNISVYLDDELVLDWKDDEVRPECSPHLTGYVCFETESDESQVCVDEVTVHLISEDVTVALTAVRVYPKGNEELKFRGLKEGPFTQRLVDARSMGANIVEITQDCWVSWDEYSTKAQPAQDLLSASVNSARYRGLMVYYQTFLWWEGYYHREGLLIPEHARQNFLENLTEVALDSARFAEKHQIEMFAPADALNEFVPRSVAKDWYQKTLPLIKEVYSGYVVIGMNDIWRVAEKETGVTEDPSECEYNYSGYDYTTLTVWFSDWRYRTFEDREGDVYSACRKDVRTLVEVGLDWSEKYGTRGVIVPFVHLTPKEEFVRAEMANGLTIGQMKARALDIFFQETLGQIDGILQVDAWYESAAQKCFIRSYPEWQERSHSAHFYWGYQGSEVEEVVKEYYTLRP